MISVTKKFTFEAAHYLKDHPRGCARMHGHSYTLEVEVSATGLDESWMIIDFGDLKKVVNEQVVDRLDHQCLNTVMVNEAGEEIRPTAENMVVWIAMQLSPFIEVPGDALERKLQRVRVWETANSFAEWKREDA